MEFPSIGLYRHFKGSYYFLYNFVTDAITGEKCCYYFNVLYPERGFYTRPVSEWFSTTTDKGVIAERPDNITGNTTRFTKVKSIDNPEKNISTKSLLKELSKRSDSPIFNFDIDGIISDKVLHTDYISGCLMHSEEHGDYLPVYVPFTDKAEAVEYARQHKGYKVYARTLVEI